MAKSNRRIGVMANSPSASTAVIPDRSVTAEGGSSVAGSAQPKSGIRAANWRFSGTLEDARMQTKVPIPINWQH